MFQRSFNLGAQITLTPYFDQLIVRAIHDSYDLNNFHIIFLSYLVNFFNFAYNGFVLFSHSKGCIYKDIFFMPALGYIHVQSFHSPRFKKTEFFSETTQQN